MAIKVALAEICKMLDQLINGKTTRENVAKWAIDIWFPEDESLLKGEPVERADEIREAIAWMMYLDMTFPANHDDIREGAEIIDPARIISTSSGKELEVYNCRLEDIKAFRLSLDTPGAIWDLDF